MDTRLILQIVLGLIIALIVVVGVLMVVALTGDAETVVVERVAEEEEEEEEENPWARQGDAAISLVEGFEVESQPSFNGDGDWTVGELVQESEFAAEELKLEGLEPSGWEAEWWGETKFGPSFYRVRYGFEDQNVTVGPTWVVDLERQEVAPKNVYGEVATDPEAGAESDYFDQSEEVVSAIVNHRFPADINLGGALLSYFGGLAEVSDEDRVLGWTVDHNRQEMFEAYFQWTDDDERVYAKFEFDFEEHALRPANLQANEIMRVGEDFEAMERVDIMPGMYDPDERLERNRWQGPARQRCQQPEHQDGCEALATVLEEDELIETLEWTLTTHVDSLDAFEACQEVQEGASAPDCRWEPEGQQEGVYRVSYLYDLGDGQQEIAWDVDLDDEELVPVDSTAELAYRAVRPRGR